MSKGSQNYDIAAIRELLLAAFTADDLRRLFLYTSNADLRPIYHHLSSALEPEALAEKAIVYCERRGLLPDLLKEVAHANPRMYAQFASQLVVTPPAPADHKDRETVTGEPIPVDIPPPRGTAAPVPTQSPATGSEDREQLPSVEIVTPSRQPTRGSLVRVLRDPFWQRVAAFIAVIALIAIVAWFWPNIRSALFPTPTPVAQVTSSPSPTATKEPSSPTPAPSDTPTRTPTRIPTPTEPPAPTATHTPTSATPPLPTATHTPTPKPPSPTPTHTLTPTRTPTPTPKPTFTPTRIPCEGDTTREVAAQLFQAYDEQNYAKALSCALTLEERWSPQAQQQQQAKQAAGCRDTPNPADQAAVDDFWRNYWALNDVATGLFLRAEILRLQDKCQEARATYRRVLDEYPCAFAWNPGGFFWSVADGAEKGLSESCP